MLSTDLPSSGPWPMTQDDNSAAPINIWAALNRTGLGGHQWGPVYLWIRVPLQGQA